MVLVCPKILQDYIISVMRLYGQEPTKLSYHTAKFGGHKHFGCGICFQFVSRSHKTT